MNIKFKIPIFLLAGTSNWGNGQDANYMIKYFPKNTICWLFRWKLPIRPFLPGAIVHFYSRYELLSSKKKWPLRMYRGRILNWFHGDPADKNSQFGKLGVSLESYIENIDFVVTSCTITYNKLLKYGIHPSKLCTIPLGIDLNLFKKPSDEQRLLARKKLNIPANVFCIASFQKDGLGWKEGLTPKLIKGPDIFIEVIKRLSKNYDIFVILSGPARGYVIKQLENHNIKYYHKYVNAHNQLLELYYASDVYLITSRDEGGPLSLLESLATGVPVVSTRVGMANDIIFHGENGLLADVEDVNQLVELVANLLEDEKLRLKIATKGIESIKPYRWESILGQYISLYRKLIYSC